jgi:hypothetical protein
MPEEREGGVVEVEREVEAAGADPRQLHALVSEQVLQVPNVVSEKERNNAPRSQGRPVIMLVADHLER